MICVVDAPIDLANFVELNNLVVNLKGESGGDTSASVLAKADFGRMKSDEKLYILAHGVVAAWGPPPHDATAFAKILLDRKLPGHIASIKLVACESGKGNDPFAKGLAGELDKQSVGKVKVRVTGFTDSAVTNQFGQTRAVDPALVRKHQREYDALFDKWKIQVAAWEKQSKAEPYDTTELLVQGASKMAKLSKAFFAELYVINEKLIKSKQDSKAHFDP
jgi:hypothetical protein